MVILRNSGIYEIAHETENKEVLLFGAGGTCLDFLKDFGEVIAGKITGIIDNNPSKQNGCIEYMAYRYPIFSLEEYIKRLEVAGEGGYAIVITCRAYQSIVEQLDREPRCDGMLCYVCSEDFLWRHSRVQTPIKCFPLGIGATQFGIPKIIHYCWFGKEPLPEKEQKCIESWKRLCPDYEFRFWNEENYDVEVIPYTRDAYKAQKYSFVSDYARLDVLYRYGGIYMDTDVYMFKRPDSLLNYEAFFAFEYWNLINTGLGCGCIKGNRIIHELLEQYRTLSFIQEDGELNLTSCPIYHTEYFRDNGVCIDNSTQVVNNILFLASEYLCPMNQFTAMYEFTENTIANHLFSCSWFDAEDKRKWEEQKAQAEVWNERLMSDHIRFLERCK